MPKLNSALAALHCRRQLYTHEMQHIGGEVVAVDIVINIGNDIKHRYEMPASALFTS